MLMPFAAWSLRVDAFRRALVRPDAGSNPNRTLWPAEHPLQSRWPLGSEDDAMTTVAVGTVMTADDPLSGRIFAGKYEIEERIGAGSMGIVYRARHVTLDKVVAVKVLHHTLAGDPSVSQRFQREARAASRLKHPCSVHVLDYGREADGTLYIVMEFIDGLDLYNLMLANRPLPPERVVSLMTQTLSALAAAHDVGVLHRDLKPENIMITTTRTDDGKCKSR
jgi:serine/threonine-protein kinase